MNIGDNHTQTQNTAKRKQGPHLELLGKGVKKGMLHINDLLKKYKVQLTLKWEIRSRKVRNNQNKIMLLQEENMRPQKLIYGKWQFFSTPIFLYSTLLHTEQPTHTHTECVPRLLHWLCSSRGTRSVWHSLGHQHHTLSDAHPHT